MFGERCGNESESGFINSSSQIDWLEEGQWVYVEYGRWTEGFTAPDDRLEEGQKIWKLDPNGCLAVADEMPEDELNLNSYKKPLMVP